MLRSFGTNQAPRIAESPSFCSTLTGRWRSTARRESTESPTRTFCTPSTHALAIEDAGDEPDRWLVIGPDRAGNLLESVVLTTAEQAQLVIHAMPMRAKFRRLLDR